MSLTTKEIKEILEILEASGWDEATVTVGEVTVTVSKNGASTLPAAPPPAPAAPVVATPVVAPPSSAPVRVPAELGAPSTNGGHTIESSTVGVFWRAPEPGAPPFVEVGTAVEPGRQLCIVEVMKLMTPVHADVAGTVRAIHVGNGEKVECGTPLLTIDPV